MYLRFMLHPEAVSFIRPGLLDMEVGGTFGTPRLGLQNLGLPKEGIQCKSLGLEMEVGGTSTGLY